MMLVNTFVRHAGQPEGVIHENAVICPEWKLIVLNAKER